MTDKVTFIIPARGGSKGIKNKNIKLFCGKPLIAWQIEEALKTKLGKVYVSSDSKKIRGVANKYGAIGVPRTKKCATDKSSSESAILDCLERIEIDREEEYSDTIFFLQATSPWITSKDMKAAYKKHIGSCGTATILTKQSHQYVHKKDKERPFECHCMFGQNRLRRQDMDRFMVEVGAYIFDTWEFELTNSRFCEGTSLKYHCIKRELPNEIDTPTDWVINETFFDYWRDGKQYYLHLEV